ncbi:MAG: ATP-binding protein, partial [Vicinamibacterales bacterium]
SLTRRLSRTTSPSMSATASRTASPPTSDLAQIFDPYFTTKRGGTGLGLPIAKNIVEGLGGTIAVESAPGAGTRFMIEFPYP